MPRAISEGQATNADTDTQSVGISYSKASEVRSEVSGCLKLNCCELWRSQEGGRGVTSKML